MGTYGSGPRLILGSRRIPMRIDYSAFTSLYSKMPDDVTDPTERMDVPIRIPDDVTRGLGLTLPAANLLQGRVVELMDKRDPMSLRRDLMESIRTYEPQMRREVFRRVVNMWRQRQTMDDTRPEVIQKSTTTTEQIEKSAYPRLYRAAPEGMELVWMTTDEEPMGGVEDEDDTPPGWPGKLLLKGGLAVGTVRHRQDGDWRKVGEGDWQPVGTGRQPGQQVQAGQQPQGQQPQGQQQPSKQQQQQQQQQRDKGSQAPSDSGRDAALQAVISAAIREHGAAAVKRAVLSAGTDIAKTVDTEMQTRATAMAGLPSVAKAITKAGGKDAKKVAKELKADPAIRRAVRHELQDIGNAVLDPAVDIVARAAGAEGKPPSKARAVLKAILKGGMGAFAFGFLDNFILYLAGAGIDKAIASAGFSGAAVAGLGNAVSDFVGKIGEKQIESMMDKIGLGDNETAGALSQKTEQSIKKWSASIGIFAGCVAGMVPMLFGVTFGKSYYLEEEDLLKGAGHKYVKRVPTGKVKPKYRYYYKVPGQRGLVEASDLQHGAKIKAEHKGKVGHFEVMGKPKNGVVTVRHDESGETIHVKEKDLAKWVQGYHRRKTVEATAKKEGKPTPQKLQHATMADLQRGEWDSIAGMGSPEELAAQAAAAGPGFEFAVIRQPMGHVLVSRKVRKAGSLKRIEGEPTELKFRSSKGSGIDTVKGRYVVMEADDLRASHKPSSAPVFDTNTNYPEGVQERRYHSVSAEADKVRRIASALDPAILVNTNPDGVNGTPIITPDNVVLGGNGRSMAMQLAYSDHPEQGAKLKEYLATNAVKYGANAADVRAMKKPVLVRQMNVKGSDKDTLRLWGRRMNESLTQGLDPRSEEVAVSHFVTDDLCQSLVDAIDPDETLSEFLYSAKAEDFTRALRRTGIIDEFNKAQFLERDSEGKVIDRLNEDGRRRVERVMAARLIPDADTLEKMNPTTREVLALSAPSIIVAEKHGWDIRASLKTAVAADLFIRRQYAHKGAAAALDEFLSQPQFAADNMGADLNKEIHADPAALALLHVVRGKIGTKKTPKDFRGFALRAIQDYQDNAFSAGTKGAVGSLFGGGETAMTPAEALDVEFGITPARAKEKTDREAAARAEEKAKKLADKQLKDQEGQTTSMFASMDSHRGTWPSLIKSAGPNRLVNRAAALAQLLVDAAVHRSSSNGRGVKVDVQRIVAHVLDDVSEAVRKDPALAKDLGVQPLTPDVVRGIVQTMVAMRSGPGEAGRLSKSMERPPGGGWIPPGGTRRGWKKQVGGKSFYWYPGQGVTAQQGTMGRDESASLEVSKYVAKDEAARVDHLNEVVRAEEIVGRVLRGLGEASPDKLVKESEFRSKVERIKNKIMRSRDMGEISELQENARDIARTAADAARTWELRQQRMFDAAPPEPEAHELTDEQVVASANEAYDLGQQNDHSFTAYMNNLQERHGGFEAHRVMEVIRHLQVERVKRATASGPPPVMPKEPKSAGRGPSRPSQMGLFAGHQGTAKGEQGSLFRSMRLYLDLVKAQPIEGQMGLFGAVPSHAGHAAAAKPPPGYQPIHGSKHGGYFRMVGGRRQYWYPDHGETGTPRGGPEEREAVQKIEAREVHAQAVDQLLADKKRMEQYVGTNPVYDVAIEAIMEAAHKHAAAINGDAKDDEEATAATHRAEVIMRRADRVWNPPAELAGQWDALLRASRHGQVEQVFQNMLDDGELMAANQAIGRLVQWTRMYEPQHDMWDRIPVTDLQREKILALVAKANAAKANAAKEPAKKPVKKPVKKPAKKPATERIVEMAKAYGIPVEVAGPRSVALGGKAAFDKDLGKWNHEKGSAARRIASTTKALAWLEGYESKAAATSEFKQKMEDRRSGGFVLGGNTYPYREQIKAAGGVWDRTKKVWLMPSAAAVQQIRLVMVQQAGAKYAQSDYSQSAPRKATPRQVDYALQLIEKLGSGWHDTDMGQGMYAPRRKELEAMSREDISVLIDEMKGEF